MPHTGGPFQGLPQAVNFAVHAGWSCLQSPPGSSVPRLETVIVAVSLTSFFFPSPPLPLPFLGPLGPRLPFGQSELSLPVPSFCVSLGNRMQFTGRGVSLFKGTLLCPW